MIPSTPVKKGHLATVGHAYGVAIDSAGTTVYVADSDYWDPGGSHIVHGNGLVVVDVTNPDLPSQANIFGPDYGACAVPWREGTRFSWKRVFWGESNAPSLDKINISSVSPIHAAWFTLRGRFPCLPRMPM